MPFHEEETVLNVNMRNSSLVIISRLFLIVLQEEEYLLLTIIIIFGVKLRKIIGAQLGICQCFEL